MRHGPDTVFSLALNRSSICLNWTEPENRRKTPMTGPDIWTLPRKTAGKISGVKSALLWSRWGYARKALITKKAPDRMKLTSAIPTR